MFWLLIACFAPPAPQLARQEGGIDVDVDVDADADRDRPRREAVAVAPGVPGVKAAVVAQAR